MAFADALFEGVARLDNVLGKRARDVNDVLAMTRCGRAIPMLACDLDLLLSAVGPDVVVDARMRKRATPEPSRPSRYRSIGLGPNFNAGDNVDLAIETAWGDTLGAVITAGPTKKLEGEPKPIDGAGRERNVYASRSGRFRTVHRIGQSVKQGEVVAVLDEHFITAPLTGCIRGLTHHGVQVEMGTKVVEIDPRSDPSTCFGLGERPKRIALGVLAAVDK
jgi:xanthine dehydrogenase accessory factor